MKMHSICALFLTCLELAVLAAGSGQPVLAVGSAGPSDSLALETFLDDYFVEKMEALDVPGAAFPIVKDGRIFPTKA